VIFETYMSPKDSLCCQARDVKEGLIRHNPISIFFFLSLLSTCVQFECLDVFLVLFVYVNIDYVMLFALRSFAFAIENWCLFRIWCFVFQFVLAKPMFDVVNVQMMKIRSSWLVNQFLVIPILAIANCSQSGKITKVELCMPKQSKSIKLKKNCC